MRLFASKRYKVAGVEKPERFWSPTGEVLVDKIEVLNGLNIETTTDKDGYTLTATIPWKLLAGAEYSPPVGEYLRGDVGVFFFDPDRQTPSLPVPRPANDATRVKQIPFRHPPLRHRRAGGCPADCHRRDFAGRGWWRPPFQCGRQSSGR